MNIWAPFCATGGSNIHERTNSFEPMATRCGVSLTMFVRDVPRDQGRVDTGVGVGYTSLAMRFSRRVRYSLTPSNCSRGKPTAIAAAADLAFLHPRENREVWIYASSDPAGVANTILDELRTVGLDWFEQFGSLEQTIAAWEAKKCRHIRDTLYLAAAYWLRGDPDRAVALVERERDQYGPFEQKRALFHEVERAAQFRDWLIQQPKSGTVSGEGARNTKPRRGKR